MKKVLVAINLLKRDDNDACITMAQNIAKIMDGKLIFVHVIDSVPQFVLSSVPDGVLEKRRADAKTALQTLAAHYDCPDSVILEGVAATEIVDYAKKIKADLIVLNSHEPKLSHYFMGSVAHQIVRCAPCSVHIVRP